MLANVEELVTSHILSLYIVKTKEEKLEINNNCVSRNYTRS